MRNNFSKILAAGFVLALAFTFSCSDDKDDDGGSGSCGTVTIGTQVWQKCNSNIDPGVGTSKCYDDLPANCDKYGRLYDWEAAKSACPQGFHLPSDAEWDVLVTKAGGSSTAGTKLKATSGWNDNANGTDEFGFSALPGGSGCYGGLFCDGGNFGYWWSSTENSASLAYSRNMYYGGAGVYRFINDKTDLLSVRCLQN